MTRRVKKQLRKWADELARIEMFFEGFKVMRVNPEDHEDFTIGIDDIHAVQEEIRDLYDPEPGKKR
jgi:hypothetical protein